MVVEGNIYMIYLLPGSVKWTTRRDNRTEGTSYINYCKHNTIYKLHLMHILSESTIHTKHDIKKEDIAKLYVCILSRVNYSLAWYSLEPYWVNIAMYVSIILHRLTVDIHYTKLGWNCVGSSGSCFVQVKWVWPGLYNIRIWLRFYIGSLI